MNNYLLAQVSRHFGTLTLSINWSVNLFSRTLILNKRKDFLFRINNFFKKIFDKILRKCVVEEYTQQMLTHCHFLPFCENVGEKIIAAMVLHFEYLLPPLFLYSCDFV